MRVVTLKAPDDFDAWREAARALVHANVPPADIAWMVEGETGNLFADVSPLPSPEIRSIAVPRYFSELARTVVCHTDAERFSLLYTLLLRVLARPAALNDQADPLVRRLEDMAKAVRRDIHKMHAFVRFREMEDGGDAPHYVAWFEPEHHVLRSAASFFVDRFTSMRWSILSPDLSIHWDRICLKEGPGTVKTAAPAGDPVEDVWKRYYSAIFNPARLKTRAMLSEMPRKYWANLPEAALIPRLVAGARAREIAMIEQASAAMPPAKAMHDDNWWTRPSPQGGPSAARACR